MKRNGMVIVVLAVLFLTGCGEQQILETVSDVQPETTEAVMQHIVVQLPPELSVPALQDEKTGDLYLCDDYSVMVQTVEAGDLAETIRNVTGINKDELQIMKSKQGSATRYQWVWAANGENGIQVGRGCIMDDGAYHYVITAMTDEINAKKVQPAWNELFASFRLVKGEPISSGS